MRCESVLILFAVLAAFSPGIVLAEDAQNATETASNADVTNATIINTTNVSVTQEPISRFTQLSNATLATTEVLGKNIAGGYRDVTKTAEHQCRIQSRARYHDPFCEGRNNKGEHGRR